MGGHYNTRHPTRHLVQHNPPTTPPHIGASWRAILIGVLLIIPNVYWVTDSAEQGDPTTVSLYFNVVFCIFVITSLNALLARIHSAAALKPGELVTIYAMLAIASSLAGHDLLSGLISMIPHAFWYATPENDWAALFHRHIPDWLAVKDKAFLTDYYRGESSFYHWEVIRGWVVTTVTWGSFVYVLLFLMVCINSIIRKQWIETEKLSYPIIQLPLALSTGRETSSILTSKMLWIGFCTAGAIDLINGLNFLYPALPSLGGKVYDIGTLFTEKPWNAIGWTPVAVYPFAVGLSTFIPLDLSFSCWFFYLFWKVVIVYDDAAKMLPNNALTYQTFGACIGLAVIVLYVTRRHLARAIRKAVTNDSSLDDSNEPMSYRTATLGTIAGVLFIMLFCNAAGMSIWVAMVFFGTYYAISIAVTRMRAELGAPVHELLYIGPDEIMPAMFGARALGPQNLTISAFFYSFNRAYRGHPMPHQLEGFKLAERTGTNNRRLLIAMLIAIVAGTLATFWAFYHISYIKGVEGLRDWLAYDTFHRLESWLGWPYQQFADFPAIIAMVLGFISTLFLMFMRMRFLWWPFHPAGYVMSYSRSMDVLWFSILISSGIKWILLKHGGRRTYRKLIPFFLGLILGEFVVGSLWSLIGIIVQRPMYRFLY